MKAAVRAAFAAAAVVAQQSAPSQPFRTGINLVEVDVVVRDRDGKVVRDLTERDFEVSEDGKPVAIDAFTAVRLAASPAPSAVQPDRSATTFSTNDYAEDGRLMLIVLDDFHIAFEGRRIVNARQIARRFIERIAPADQVAMVSTSSRGELSVEFTSDKARLSDALDNFMPSGGSAMGAESTLKARFAIDRLNHAAKALARVPHRRKSVVLVSEGFPFGIESLMQGADGSDSDLVLTEMRDFIQTAQRTNIAVYALDPAGLDVSRSLDRRDTLRSISEGTGGFATVDTNEFDGGIDRVMDESGTHYLLAYASPAQPFDGKFHRIRVRTARQDLRVSARTGYVAPRSAPKDVAEPANPLDDLTGAAVQARGLPMRVAALPMPSTHGVSLAVVIDVPAPALVGGVEISVSAVDLADGKVKASDRIQSKIREGGPADGSWVRVASRVDVRPGRYQVRVAARTLDGPARGSVFAEVQAPKFGGDVAAGGLFLGTRGSGGAIHAESLSKALPALPLALRELPHGLPLVAALPIKVATKRSNDALAIAAILTRPDGSTQELERVTRPASTFARDIGDVYMVALPAGAAAGQYRVRIEAALPNKKPVIRELSFDLLP